MSDGGGDQPKAGQCAPTHSELTSRPYYVSNRRERCSVAALDGTLLMDVDMGRDARWFAVWIALAFGVAVAIGVGIVYFIWA